MFRKQLAALAVLIACALSPAEAQTYKDASGTIVPGVVPLVGCSTGGNCTAPVSNTNPLPISGSFSAAGFTPNGNSANIGSVTTSSSYVALPTGAVVVVYNSGSAAITTKLGTTSGVTVTATTGDVIQPGSWISYTVGSNTYLAAITASGSSSLVITAGTGQPGGSGGGSSSSGGGAITAASGAYAAGSFAVGAGVDGWNQTEGAKGDSAYAGSGSASIVAVLKGIYSAASTGTGATGAAYPTSAVLFGCAYNTTLPTATSGNLYSEQCDASARQIVVGAGVAGTPAGGVFSMQGVASGTPVIINETQIGGNAVNTGTGASGTGTQRVAVSTDSPGGAAANPAFVENPSGDACQTQTKHTAPINLTASGQIITGTASKKTYICSINLISATAQNVALVEGTGSTCGTNTYGLAGGTTAATGWNLAANGGLTLGGGEAFVIGGDADTNGSAANVCLLSSSTGQISGTLTYAQQ